MFAGEDVVVVADPEFVKPAPEMKFFSEIERNISFLGACSLNEKYALLKLKLCSCSKKNDSSFKSMFPKLKSRAPELKIFVLFKKS